MVERLTPSQSALVAESWPWAQQVARSMAQTCMRSSVDDLCGWASLGLIDAATRYDPDLGVLFSTFARRRVVGAIIDGYRAHHDWNWRSRRSPEVWSLTSVDGEYQHQVPVDDLGFDRVNDAVAAASIIRDLVPRLTGRERDVLVSFGSGCSSSAAADLGVGYSRIAQMRRSMRTKVQDLEAS